MRQFRWMTISAIVLIITLTSIKMCSPQSLPPFFLGGKDETPEGAESGNESTNLNGREVHECYILIQESRRIGGQCVKMGDRIQSCVAGAFILPFHHSCL